VRPLLSSVRAVLDIRVANGSGHRLPLRPRRRRALPGAAEVPLGWALPRRVAAATARAPFRKQSLQPAYPASSSARLPSNFRQLLEVTAMCLRFLGGDTGDGGSPRLYQEGDDYLVQGYLVTDPGLLAKLQIPPGETVVRVPASLWKYLPARSGRGQGAEDSTGHRHASPPGDE